MSSSLTQDIKVILHTLVPVRNRLCHRPPWTVAFGPGEVRLAWQPRAPEPAGLRRLRVANARCSRMSCESREHGGCGDGLGALNCFHGGHQHSGTLAAAGARAGADPARRGKDLSLRRGAAAEDVPLEAEQAAGAQGLDTRLPRARIRTPQREGARRRQARRRQARRRQGRGATRRPRTISG